MDRSALIGCAASIALLKMCDLSSSTSSSPIGRLKITFCSQGLHAISQVATINDQSFRPDPKQPIAIESTDGQGTLPPSCLEWLEHYFHASDEPLKTPALCPSVISKDHSFQENVWHTLLTHVPFGQTITYGRLAELAGNGKAARAVGTAMRRNPFQLLVPCHRVIRSNGEMGNYAGGERNKVKSWLLEHEERH